MLLPARLVSTSMTMKMLKMFQARNTFWLMWLDWTECVNVLQQLVSNKMSAVISPGEYCWLTACWSVNSRLAVSQKVQSRTVSEKQKLKHSNTNYSTERLTLVASQVFLFIYFFLFAFVSTSNPALMKRRTEDASQKVPSPVTSPALFDFLWCPKINIAIHLTRRRRRRVEFVTLWAKSFG